MIIFSGKTFDANRENIFNIVLNFITKKQRI